MNNGCFALLRVWIFCGCVGIGFGGHWTWARGPAVAAQTASLPMVLPDEFGVRWDIQHDGSVSDGGNDLYDGGGHLFLDNNMQWSSGRIAQFDRERNELVLGPTTYAGLNISRRVAVNQKLGFCRWAEVFENPGAQKVSIRFRVRFDMGGSIQAVSPLIDQRRNGQTIGMAIGDQRHCVGVMGAGRGSRLVPRFMPQQGGDDFNLFYELEIPPRQTAVVVHVQIYRQQLLAASAALDEIKEREYLAQLPKELQRRVVNFRGGESIIGDLEILRGDVFDVVELRGGDLLRGRISETSYQLQTLYGRLELPVDKVVSLLNVGHFRPRQLVVMRDGEVFGGHLIQQEISLHLSSGQQMAVPIRQLSRMGYRSKAGEREEWTFNKPMVFLRRGDRMEVKLPAETVSVSTRYGVLKLRPEMIASITYQLEEQAAHQVQLTDGSRLAGLVLMDSYNLELAGAAAGQRVQLPASSIVQMQFNGRIDEPDDATAVMSLANGDSLVGSLTGQLRLQTEFDTIAINCGEIKALEALKTSPSDVRIVLWDESVVAGMLHEPMLDFVAGCGVSVRVPAALVDQYIQPRPTPSEAVIESIKKLVVALSADDWRIRDEAQDKLITMGPVAISTLKQLRNREGPEAQQRIDMIIPMLERMGRSDRRD